MYSFVAQTHDQKGNVIECISYDADSLDAAVATALYTDMFQKREYVKPELLTVKKIPCLKDL